MLKHTDTELLSLAADNIKHSMPPNYYSSAKHEALYHIEKAIKALKDGEVFDRVPWATESKLTAEV